MNNLKFKLNNIYLEELNLNKLDDKESTKDITIEIQNKIMQNKENKSEIRCLFNAELIIYNSYEITIFYDAYFIINSKSNYIPQFESFNKEKVSEIFNEKIWPYLTEQINYLTTKIKVDSPVKLPTYDVIADDSE